MTPHQPPQHPPNGGRGIPDIAAALEVSRERARQQWTQIADGVMEQAMRATRTSLPVLVRTEADGSRTLLAGQVLVSLIRHDLDTQLPASVVGRIVLASNTDDSLRHVTVELFGQYGSDLLAQADIARSVLVGTLVEQLGLSLPTTGGEDDEGPMTLTVRAGHTGVPLDVHYSDITRGDPHLVDPDDEAQSDQT